MAGCGLLAYADGSRDSAPTRLTVLVSCLRLWVGGATCQAIQACMLPMELFTSPIAGKYLLGSKTATPYDEKLEPYVPADDESSKRLRR